jgi:hypothetical protein
MLASELPDIVDDREELARFLTQSNQFNTIMIKPSAFLPNPKDHETSVSRHGKEPLTRLWEIGLAVAGTRTLYGAAIFKARDVKNAKLEIVADEPPARHAVIKGWPWFESDLELQKAKQKELATLLASAAGSPQLRQSSSL